MFQGIFIVDVFLYVGKYLAAYLIGAFVEYDYIHSHIVFHKKGAYPLDGYP